MKTFHITLSQGRADTIYLHSTSSNKVLNFLNSISTAIVRNIKEVVFSKNFAIGLSSNNNEFVSTLTYHKVILFAYSKNYSQQFILYNVKRSITQEYLIEQYKKLLILDEPIVGFFDIQFYNEIAKNENIDNLYQVQYKRNSKTYTEDFYSSSLDNVKDFFKNVIDGELMEIRKYVHLDTTIKKDDKDYRKRMSVYIDDNKYFFSVSIPKVRNELNNTQILNLIKTNLSFNKKNIDKEDITLTFR